MRRSIKRPLLIVWLLALMLAATIAPAFAQSPTSVPIEVDTNTFIESANNWISSLGDVLAVPIGLGIAFAILFFVGRKLFEFFYENL